MSEEVKRKVFGLTFWSDRGIHVSLNAIDILCQKYIAMLINKITEMHVLMVSKK